jgi:hypothetical protein
MERSMTIKQNEIGEARKSLKRKVDMDKEKGVIYGKNN